MSVRCLSAIYAVGGLLDDRDADGLPDAVRARLIVGCGSRLPEHLAAVDVAARLGFETLALSLPLACSNRDQVGDETTPIYIGRPDTLPPACPRHLRDALSGLARDEGLVALSTDPDPALLIGGFDPAGLADAARVVAACLPYLRVDGRPRHDLAALCDTLHCLAGHGPRPLAEALVTRQGQVAELHLRVAVTAAEREAARQAWLALDAHDTLPCDLTVILDTGAGNVDRLRIGSPAGLAQQRDRCGQVGLGRTARADVVVEERPGIPTPTEIELAPLRSLAGWYGPAGAALDSDGDLLPDRSRTHLLLPDDLSPAEAVEAAHAGARLGLETLGLALPLAHPASATPTDVGRIAIRVVPLDDTGGLDARQGELRLIEATGERSVLEVRGGDATGRAMALRELVGLDPFDAPDDEPSLEQMQLLLQRICALASRDGPACGALAAVDDVPEQALIASPDPLALRLSLPGVSQAERAAVARAVAERMQQRSAALALDVRVDEAESVPVLDETHRLVWEADEIWAHMETQVLPALLSAQTRAGGGWFLDLRLSEPEGRRRQVKGAILQWLKAAGVVMSGDQVRVLPAYRQGRSWLLEEVAPRLLGRDVATLVVRVQRFQRTYPCLELPIRWLQDLHPVDEMLEERLGLARGAVRFEMANQAHTYDVEAYDGAGVVIWQGTFDVTHGRRPYLEGFPDWGTIHPPTGCVRLLRDGQPIVEAHVAPDPERVWDLVQMTLLPRLRAHVLAVADGTPRVQDQPFFDSLTIESWLSEEDSVLGPREERDSPLESLHEDLYFMLLDYCSALLAPAEGGEPYRPPWVRSPSAHQPRRGARLWTAPGRIVPSIHRADGAGGRVRLCLTALPERQPRLSWSRGAESGVVPLVAAPDVTIRVTGLRLAAAQGGAPKPARRLLIDIDGPPPAQERARRLLAAWGTLRSAGAAPGRDIPVRWSLAVRDSSGQALDLAPGAPALAASEEPRRGPDASGGPHDVPWDRVLGPDDVESSLRALARSPYARVYQAGRSARGRPLHAVELTVPRRDGLWSRARLGGWKCTLLLNARHHANEPSSTNALLKLADLLAHDATWRRYLDRINVVLIPCENPDGAVLYDALQGEHPAWMLHAGRYNDAGLEFVAEYANPTTRHTEALVLPTLWRRWAPDIVCDDHGFPAHEWAQPFAGHSNPWFQSHWIVQGLIYLILPRVANSRYPHHAAAFDSLRRRLVGALAGDPDVRARNSTYADRYRTFLSDRLPDAFPAHFEEDVLVHILDYDPDDPEQRRTSLAGPAGAYPGVTTLSMITEVADETAQGRYMALCAHAHLLANRALLDYLFGANAPTIIQREHSRLPSGDILLRAVRPRPVLARDEPPAGRSDAATP